MEYYKVEEREEHAASGSDIKEYQGKCGTKKVSLMLLNFTYMIRCKPIVKLSNSKLIWF